MLKKFLFHIVSIFMIIFIGPLVFLMLTPTGILIVLGISALNKFEIVVILYFIIMIVALGFYIRFFKSKNYKEIFKDDIIKKEKYSDKNIKEKIIVWLEEIKKKKSQKENSIGKIINKIFNVLLNCFGLLVGLVILITGGALVVGVGYWFLKILFIIGLFILGIIGGILYLFISFFPWSLIALFFL